MCCTHACVHVWDRSAPVRGAEKSTGPAFLINILFGCKWKKVFCVFTNRFEMKINFLFYTWNRAFRKTGFKISFFAAPSEKCHFLGRYFKPVTGKKTPKKSVFFLFPSENRGLKTACEPSYCTKSGKCELGMF